MEPLFEYSECANEVAGGPKLASGVPTGRVDWAQAQTADGKPQNMQRKLADELSQWRSVPRGDLALRKSCWRPLWPAQQPAGLRLHSTAPWSRPGALATPSASILVMLHGRRDDLQPQCAGARALRESLAPLAWVQRARAFGWDPLLSSVQLARARDRALTSRGSCGCVR